MPEANTFFADYQSLMKDISGVKKDGKNPHFGNSYATLDEVLSVTKDACLKHNFILVLRTEYATGKLVLVGEIQHKSGEKIISAMGVVAKDQEDPQKVGAGLTYAKRQLLTCMFGLEEEDDDGNVASSVATKPTNREPAASPAPVGKKYEDNDNPWMDDATFVNAIQRLVDAKVVKWGMDTKEVAKILRTKYKVAKKYEALIDKEVEKAVGLAPKDDEIKIEELPL